MSGALCLSNLFDDTQCDVCYCIRTQVDIHTAKMYLDSIHKNYLSIVKVDNNTDRTANNVYFIGKGGVAFLLKKNPSDLFSQGNTLS